MEGFQTEQDGGKPVSLPPHSQRRLRGTLILGSTSDAQKGAATSALARPAGQDGTTVLHTVVARERLSTAVAACDGSIRTCRTSRPPVSSVIDNARVEIEPRPLTVAERSVLDLLLEADREGADALRQQARTALVVGRCDCGCPTVDFAISDDSPRATVSARLWPVEGRVDSQRAMPGQEHLPGEEVLLFVDDGLLSALELVFYTERPPESWPPAEDIRLV